MKARSVYWRKKGKAIILEGRNSSNKPVLIWTLPDANKFYEQILQNASFLTKEKRTSINEKWARLRIRGDVDAKNA